MTTYRERREQRAARLREWAEKRETRATQSTEAARQLADLIPFGQPILVGHHSEGRDQRTRSRIEGSGFEHAAKAGEFRQRADTIDAQAERSIYSDDADAIERLEDRIAELETERDRIKAYNTSCRRGAPDLSLLDEAQRAKLASAQSVGFGGKADAFPSYALTNLSGNIAWNRKRLAGLRAKATQ